MPFLTEETCRPCIIVHHAPAVRYTAPLLLQPHRRQDMQIYFYFFYFVFFSFSKKTKKKGVDHPERLYRSLRTLHAHPFDEIVVQHICSLQLCVPKLASNRIIYTQCNVEKSLILSKAHTIVRYEWFCIPLKALYHRSV